MASLIFILPAPGERKEGYDFTLQKKLQINRDGSGLFTVRTNRQSFIAPIGTVELEDPIDSGANLIGANPEPDYYYEQGTKKRGYPPKSSYSTVKKMSWTFPEPKKWIQESTSTTIRYEYNCHYREDFKTFPECTVTDFRKIPLEKVCPILQMVEGEQWLFVSLSEGILQALNPRSFKVYWEHIFPLGESVTTGFVSFRRQNKSYIACVTNQSRFFLFNAVDGSILWKMEIEGNLNAPLQVFSEEEESWILILTDQKWMLLNPYQQKVEFLKKTAHSLSLSPLLVQIPGEFRIFLAYPSGLVESYDRYGNMVWGTQVKGEIFFDPSALVKDGTLHLVLATGEKLLYWIDGFSGAIRAVDKLPGFPRSPISFAREGLDYSLLVSQDLQKSLNSYFFSGSLENTKLPRVRIPIPGNSFFGLDAIRTTYNECYYILSADYSWMVINKANKSLTRPYPISLLPMVKPTEGFLEGREVVFCEGAVLINIHENGLLVLGVPNQAGENTSLQSIAQNSSMDFTATSEIFSGGRCRTDMDYLPEPVLTLQKRWDLSPSSNLQEIIAPLALFLEKQKKWILVMPGKDGKVSFLDDRGEIWKQFAFQEDPILTQPIVRINSDGSMIMYILSTTSLTKVYIEPTLQKYKVIWKTEDLGSLGGSFNIVSMPDKKRLVFVDSLSYLTVVDEESSDILFRVKVDSFTFAMTKLLGTWKIYCGSKGILLNGEEAETDLSALSDSTTLGLLGTTFLFQSDDLDMTCRDIQSGEIRWRVRKLWCKAYCFGYHAPAVYKLEDQALTYWADYKRVICIDVGSGMIRWIYFTPDDYFHSKPTVTVVEGRPVVYVGSIRGNLYAFDGLSGIPIFPVPFSLPGKEENTDSLKGLSSPVLLNGCLWISRMEFGIFRIGTLKPPNQRFFPVFLTLGKKETQKKSFIFNRAILYWDLYYRFSERVKWKITEGNPIIFLTFLKKMKKLM